MRILILAGLIYLLYRALKRWMAIDLMSVKKTVRESQGQLDDLMIKDPFCGTFFPKQEGVKVRWNGEDLYFCSTKCRDSYLQQQPNDTAS